MSGQTGTFTGAREQYRTHPGANVCLWDLRGGRSQERARGARSSYPRVGLGGDSPRKQLKDPKVSRPAIRTEPFFFEPATKTLMTPTQRPPTPVAATAGHRAACRSRGQALRAWSLGGCLTFTACNGFVGGENGEMPAPPAATSGATSSAGAAGAAAGGGPSAPSAPGSTPLRRLTTTEYANSIADLLGVEPPSTTGIVSSVDAEFDSSGEQFSISVPLVEQYLILAEALAKAADLSKLSSCDPGQSDEATCLQEFLDHFGRRAFRRLLEPDEIASYSAQFAESRKVDDYATSLRSVLTRLLVSPEFLHHVELGVAAPVDNASPLVTTHELASRLSYLLWESMPDDALFEAAATGALNDPAVLDAQVSRMLQSPRARDMVSHFHRQWLKLDSLDGATKDAKLYPDWAAAEKDVISGTLRFVDDVVFRGAGDVRLLLTSPRTFANDKLAKLYGFPGTGPDFAAVELDPNQRAGLLTQPAFLATFGKADKSSPILRGVFILRRLMCNAVPPPPADVNKMVDDAPPATTTREFFANLTSGPTCQACHGLINPIGWGLEHFDAIGAYRDAEGGQPIDASGELKTGDQLGSFVGARELSERLAASSEVKACLVKQWFRYGYGRSEVEGDSATLADIQASFEQSGGQILALPRALANNQAFQRLHYTLGSR